MGPQINLTEINKRVRIMKKAAEELKQMADKFPALDRNTARILANIKMLEINISDVLDLEK